MGSREGSVREGQHRHRQEEEGGAAHAGPDVVLVADGLISEGTAEGGGGGGSETAHAGPDVVLVADGLISEGTGEGGGGGQRHTWHRFNPVGDRYRHQAAVAM